MYTPHLHPIYLISINLSDFVLYLEIPFVDIIISNYAINPSAGRCRTDSEKVLSTLLRTFQF